MLEQEFDIGVNDLADGLVSAIDPECCQFNENFRLMEQLILLSVESIFTQQQKCSEQLFEISNELFQQNRFILNYIFNH